MNYEQRRINWPALAASAALALGVTLGLPAAMDAGTATDGYLSILASANAPATTQVAIQPQRIEVIAVREHPSVQGFSFTAQKRAG